MPDHFRGKTGKAREKALREHRRATMVAQPSTAVRNISSQKSKLGMEGADKLWDKSGAQKIASGGQDPQSKSRARHKRYEAGQPHKFLPILPRIKTKRKEEKYT
jgi:hypothetical protein